jgi:hypothetical protein
MSEQKLKPDADRVAETAVAREGCLRVVLAVPAGTLAFFATLGLLSTSPDLPEDAQTFMGWAGAGPMAVLVAAFLAPRRRWLIALPLLLILEWGLSIADIIIAGFGESSVPGEAGMLTGAKVGVALGIILIARCRPTLPPRRRRMMIGLTVVSLLAGRLMLPVVGERYLDRVRQVLPDFEKLVRADVLVRTGPVSWRQPQWRPGGRFTASAEGEMVYRRIRLELEINDPFRLLAHRPGTLEGLTVGLRSPIWLTKPPGLGIWLPQPRHLNPDESITPGFLEAMGVQPILAQRIHRPGGQGYMATYHGMTYHASADHWRNGTDWMILWCSGAYTASGP